MLNKNYSWFKTLGVHFVLGTVFSSFIYFNPTLFNNTIPFYNFDIETFISYDIEEIGLNLLFYFILIGAFYTLHLFEKLKILSIKTNALNENLKQNKLMILQSQLQPNLVFNGLNAISSLMPNNILLAQNTTIELSDYLRAIFKNKDENFIPINEEIILTNKYVKIVGARFNNPIKIKLNFHKNVKNCLMPNMFFPSIIENITKHNLQDGNDQFFLKINVKKKKKRIIILIEHNGKPKYIEKSEFNDPGLNNLLERLDLLFKDNIKFKYSNNSEVNITKISFPCKKN